MRQGLPHWIDHTERIHVKRKRLYKNVDELWIVWKIKLPFLSSLDGFLCQQCEKELLTWCGHMTVGGFCLVVYTPSSPAHSSSCCCCPRGRHCPQSTQAVGKGRCWKCWKHNHQVGGGSPNSICTHYKGKSGLNCLQNIFVFLVRNVGNG